MAFAFAGLLAVLVSWGASLAVEALSQRALTERLAAQGIDWATIEPDGMLVHITGTAPTEAARFRLLNIVGSQIDSSRIRDRLKVTPARELEAPRFSIEMLRNDDGIQLIGLLPSGGAKVVLSTAASDIAGEIPVTDMLESSSFPAPAGWQPAFDFGIAALKLLPRSKISVAADGVSVTAIAASEAEKRSLEAELARNKPAGLKISIDISAPRPVLTPFTLRFVKDAEGARFDACSADTEAARNRILAAAAKAGVEGKAGCIVGLGVPTPSWAEAAEAGIAAVAALGAGTITFSDADVSLVAVEDTPQDVFDRVVGELQTALPDVFSLDAKLPKKADAAPAGPAEFTAVLADTGKVELRGRVTDAMQRKAVDNFAKAQFGSSKVYIATRNDPDLPEGWPVRVLAGLEALSQLHEGKLSVRADTVEVSGVTGMQGAKDRISQILSNKLGQGKAFKVSVRYDEKLDPLAALPTPQECVERVNALVAKQKITFEPGSAEIDGSAAGLMTAMASALEQCKALPMEISGHTDAQGSEEGNKALSQARAEAVLVALQGRRVDVSEMSAIGYGEERPIADNATDAGREANRRIEFHLIGEEPAPVAPQGGAVAATSGPVIRGTVVQALGTPATPEACLADIGTLLRVQKIGFEPGEAKISEASEGLVTALAVLLKKCPGVPIEVAGHTDSQGSEGGNKRLSEDRAKAVLVAMAQQGVDVATMKAVGYGEEKPIADNETEEGREANRRIEFNLIAAAPAGPSPAPATGAAAAEAAPAGTVAEGPDFSSDTSPSIAPQEKTLRPKPRPANN
ncbi:OmpA family protein [Paragemmobacter straminiformis]|nr:OmpA family protein [Gemmobacter straminiformis]